MGRSKALLPVEGTTLVEWLAARLAPGFPELLVAAREPSQLPPGLRRNFVADRRPQAGPLAGVEAGLAAARHSTVVVVACDMPYVTRALAARLAASAEGHDAAVPRLGDRVQPACAAYRRTALRVITANLDGGRRSASEALRGLDVNWLIEDDPMPFVNLNSPDDYRAFLAEIPKTR
jgi:molybdopterin-guanine dinucleotide biosynthesis protein A